MIKKKYSHRTRPSGFTLLELLVVLTIIVIVAALSVPAISSMVGSYALDSATEGVLGQLNLARQNALSSNHPVQVRFYQITDYNGGTPTVWRAMQCFLQDDTAVTPITKPYFFPSGVIIVDNATKLSGSDPSSLLDPTYCGIINVPAGDVAHPLPPPYNATPYTYFLYRSDGQVDQSTMGTTAWSNCCLTLTLESAPKQASGLPSNYATVQVNAITGSVRVFRP